MTSLEGEDGVESDAELADLLLNRYSMSLPYAVAFVS